MKSRWTWFNFILIFVLAVSFVGCHSDKAEKQGKTKKEKKDKKEYTVLELHLETGSSVSGANVVPIYRQKPIYLSVEPNAFLNTSSITNATVIDYMGGYALKFQLDQHGAFVLETVTTANKTRRIAVLAAFPEVRWLAAPIIAQGNTSGVFVFTPDASREECDRIVRGINNVATEIRKRRRD